MNQQDLNELTQNWHSDTNWLNEKIDDAFKRAQDHAYALGLKRGLQDKIAAITDAQILDASTEFGEFCHGDAQGHKRIEFARAVLSLAAKATTQEGSAA